MASKRKKPEVKHRSHVSEMFPAMWKQLQLLERIVIANDDAAGRHEDPMIKYMRKIRREAMGTAVRSLKLVVKDQEAIDQRIAELEGKIKRPAGRSQQTENKQGPPISRPGPAGPVLSETG